jgi:hypothetical protein
MQQHAVIFFSKLLQPVERARGNPSSDNCLPVMRLVGTAQ